MQDYIDYHLTWLVGVLKHSYSTNLALYQQQIDEILSELRDE